eukprot:s218_g38.t3
MKVIGKGSYGKVMLVRHKTEGEDQVYAMKMLRKENVIKRNQVEHTKTERNVLEAVSHPFIVTLHYAFQTPKKLYFVLEYCPGGELFFHLSRAGRFSEGRCSFSSRRRVRRSLHRLFRLDLAMLHCFSGLLRWLARRCCRRPVKAAVASVEVNGRQYRVIRILNFNGQFMLRTGLDYDLANDKEDIEQPGRFSCWGFANKDYARMSECTEETASPDLSEDGMSEELSRADGPQPRTIFHALHLTFDDIRRILPELAWKGFDAIQIPPAQVSPNGDLRGDWYLRYQPVNYQHIDLRLGGAESLQRLCEEASGHGMTVNLGRSIS